MAACRSTCIGAAARAVAAASSRTPLERNGPGADFGWGLQIRGSYTVVEAIVVMTSRHALLAVMHAQVWLLWRLPAGGHARATATRRTLDWNSPS